MLEIVSVVLPLVRSAAEHEKHEALCRRCGMSCFFAVPVNGLPVVIDELHCKFLGREADGRYGCTVYERRYTVAPWCHSAQEALQRGLLAQDCPYVRAAGVSGYRGKVRLHGALLQKVLPQVRAEVRRAGVPIGADPEAALRFLGEPEEGGRLRYRTSEDGTRYLFEPE
jgi:hypothetical protein